MHSEVLQFGAMMLLFAVALSLWLRIIYLPGRTLERWEDRRSRIRNAQAGNLRLRSATVVSSRC